MCECQDKGKLNIDKIAIIVKIVNMTPLVISATDLKRDTSEILNSVIYGGSEATIERFGEPVARIVPISKGIKKDLKDKIKLYFGSLPDFPKVRKDRFFRNRVIRL